VVIAIEKTIAESAADFCQDTSSPKNTMEVITPTTGATKAEIAATLVGKFAIKIDHNM